MIELHTAMRFEFDPAKSQDVKRKHGVSRTTPTADEIAERASRGEDVSAYFTNSTSLCRT